MPVSKSIKYKIACIYFDTISYFLVLSLSLFPSPRSFRFSSRLLSPVTSRINNKDSDHFPDIDLNFNILWVQY